MIRRNSLNKSVLFLVCNFRMHFKCMRTKNCAKHVFLYVGIPSHRNFIDDITTGEVPNSGHRKSRESEHLVRIKYRGHVCSNQVFGCLSYNREIYDYRHHGTSETGGAAALMVVYTESGPKTNRPTSTTLCRVGWSAEIVNSISPRISSGP